ncbi:lantibiotic dehydratase [Compostibacter hankyongensis]|uniref:Lantibiotic dehydratase n=1 Tax=Compostibacter hankyongensis TaxID=1007089 RepID=A0ABP8FWY3_9BACT
MKSVFDYTFYPRLMLRMPAFDHHRYDRPLGTVLSDPYFNAAIFWASRSLFDALEKCNFEYALLSEKQKVSLKMYLNRMCFRPTPFGLFSGFSLISWGGKRAQPFLFDPPRLHFRIDYEYGRIIAGRIIEEHEGFSQWYVLNSSLYKVGGEYRYLKSDTHEGASQKEFTIEFLQSDEVINEILSYCITKRSGKDILSFLGNQFGANLKESEEFLNELIERQVIVPSLLPNITGADYLERIADSIIKENPDKNRAGFPDEVYRKIIPVDDHILDTSVELDKKIRACAGDAAADHSTAYLNLERPAISGALAPRFQHKMLEGLYAIDMLLPRQENDYLKRFSSAFTRKFDHRWIPLLTALDPEIGVGEEVTQTGAGASSLISDMRLDFHQLSSGQIEWTAAHALLLDKWNTLKRAENKNFTLVLEDQDLQRLAEPDKFRYPPSISVVFRTTGDCVFIEQAGGSTASALPGRFSPFSADLHRCLTDIVRVEEESNPEVVFAEIAHCGDSHIANVERRNIFRKYEIPVLTGSALPEEGQIAPNDLWVTVQNGEIMLWSKRLKKRVIPRLTSAFNYFRSDLPVFRFLCDLQHQGLRSNFNFELPLFFPDLSFYPRVRYRNCILSLASWHLDREDIGNLLKSDETVPGALKKAASTLWWPRYISLNKYDNYLVFDTEKEDDLAFLGKMLKKDDKIIIKEFPFMDAASGKGSPAYDTHIRQYFTCLYHHEKIYDAVSPGLDQPATVKPVIRKFLPGSMWYYFKIYCHPQRASEMLVNYILPLCKRWISAGFLNQWFFVRYGDPEFHLRIRFNLIPVHAGLIIRVLNQCLSPLTDSGLIRDFQVATYERELERYNPEVMDELESCFCASAALVMKFLENDSRIAHVPLALYEMAYGSIEALLNIFSYDIKAKIRLFAGLHKAMEAEFGASAEIKAQLRRKFREIRSMAPSDIVEPIMIKYGVTVPFNIFKYVHKQIAGISASWPPSKKDSLMGDLIHMHLNRLFSGSPRKNEFILYYCLWRHYESCLGRMQKTLGASFADN